MSALRAHHDKAHTKFSTPCISHLHDTGIYLLPFTVDHLGGLGPFSSTFFFGSPDPAFPEPSWTQSANFPSNPAAFRAYTITHDHAPRNLFSSADAAWRSAHPPGQPVPRFGSTYHTHTPSQWASQALGLNISLALATHLSRGISRLLSHDMSRRKLEQNSSVATTPFRAPPPPFLPPGPCIDSLWLDPPLDTAADAQPPRLPVSPTDSPT